jgi:hypothetical protein
VALENREESGSQHGKVHILTGLDLPRSRERHLDLKTVVNALHQNASAGLAHGKVTIDEEDVSVGVGCSPYTRPHDDLDSSYFVCFGNMKPQQYTYCCRAAKVNYLEYLVGTVTEGG